ncbi:MAG: hypothetical protein EHM36_04210 [Deltaproteobacteria bacterium]|nr:MAG: hypothetical protein EHM36_04210 [Deltaproteobacteria bacterium]
MLLTPTYEFHWAVGIPRSVAIEYPYGRPVGQVGDREGQKRVLLETLSFLEKAKRPGEVLHLPFTWPEDPKKTDWQPPEMSPLIKHYLEEIKTARQRASEKESDSVAKPGSKS